VTTTSHPALEDGTDRGFRNVGNQLSDAGETPKRIHNKYNYRRVCCNPMTGVCWKRSGISSHKWL